jgi:septum formation protein
MKYHPINKSNPLVLASVSPRRKDILGQVGIPFESAGSFVEENFDEGIKPADIACKIAALKAGSVQNDYKNRWILGADTIVTVNGKVFGKPKDRLECRDMLLDLSGRIHSVTTGFCILDPGGKAVHLQAVETGVAVKKLSELEIDAYIKTGEPFGKAGAYAIQGIGSFMVERINGSYTNVVGLPVYEVVAALIKCGALEGFPLVF